MSEKTASKNWFARHAEAQAKKDYLKPSDRRGEVASIVPILLITLFFALHQISSTGFFTSKFGPAEIFFFYLPPVLGVVTAVARAIIGRRNTVRPLDVFQMGVIAVALVWLFVVFPFEFSHLADVLPGFLRFLLQWISNDVVKAITAIGIVGIPVVIVYIAALYVFVRRELRS